MMSFRVITAVGLVLLTLALCLIPRAPIALADERLEFDLSKGCLEIYLDSNKRIVIQQYASSGNYQISYLSSSGGTIVLTGNSAGGYYDAGKAYVSVVNTESCGPLHITLQNATIENGAIAAVMFNQSDAELTLAGENRLKGQPCGLTLKASDISVRGSGALTIRGADGTEASASGDGAPAVRMEASSLTMYGGTLTVIGGARSDAQGARDGVALLRTLATDGLHFAATGAYANAKDRYVSVQDEPYASYAWEWDGATPLCATLNAPKASDYAYVRVEPSQYTIDFNANGGGNASGANQMTTITARPRSLIDVPACGFIAPPGKQFGGWLVGGDRFTPGGSYRVTGNATFVAQWADVDDGPWKPPVEIPMIPDAPKTGDESAVEVWIGFILAGMASMFWFGKRRAAPYR